MFPKRNKEKRTEDTIKMKKYIKFQGKTYALNLERLKDVCFNSSSGQSDVEISEVYEPDVEGVLTITQKAKHETKASKSVENNEMFFEIIKMLLISILENEVPEPDYTMDFGTAFALNSLIHWGVIDVVED